MPLARKTIERAQAEFVQPTQEQQLAEIDRCGESARREAAIDWAARANAAAKSEAVVDEASHESANQYEYEPIENLEGWNIAVWQDGRALPCSPGTCPEELGGYEAALATRDEALASALKLAEGL